MVIFVHEKMNGLKNNDNYVGFGYDEIHTPVF